MGKKTPKIAPSPWEFVTLLELLEEDRSTAIDNISKNLVEIKSVVPGYPGGKTEREYTDILITILAGDECIICYIMLHVTTGDIANLSTRISQL